MNNHQEAPEAKETGPPHDEIKREIKREIAEAILGGTTAPGASDKEPKTATKPEADDKSKSGKPPQHEGFHWTFWKIFGLVALVIAIAVGVTLYLLSADKSESTDDAYTTSFVHQISSRVTGNVAALLIVDNEHVTAGQVLLRLDPRDYVVQVEKAQANYDRALADYERVDALKADVAISKQDYDQTKTNMEVGRANLDDALNQLSYCTIVSPTDGFIGNRTVNLGDRVTVGGALMAVVQDVWIVANFKETQIGRMKKDQPVKISVDAFPSRTFRGHVDSFSPGTGTTFALLPSDNATGNFTKIVQRVPVKILFEPESLREFPGRLSPGLSVITTVDLDPKVTKGENPRSKESQ